MRNMNNAAAKAAAAATVELLLSFYSAFTLCYWDGNKFQNKLFIREIGQRLRKNLRNDSKV